MKLTLNNKIVKPSSISSYENRKKVLLEAFQKIQGPISLNKKTSNLFRYQPRDNKQRHKIDLGHFNHILRLDTEQKTLEVEGLTTYETIAQYTLAHGFLPTVIPELKHITLGGAIVGVGIESTGFKYGFVHDGLVEAEVLLPNGCVVLCQPDNEYADLFKALPNSYGTLGYILRAKIKLYSVKPYVHLITTRFNNVEDYLDAMYIAAREQQYDFVEGLFYKEDELYLTTGKLVNEAKQLSSIYKNNIYYKQLRNNTELFLSTIDYIFRFDPEWFWNLPETPFYKLFRLLAPQSLRNSGFYKRYTSIKNNLLQKLSLQNNKIDEPLIQDWEVPWEQAKDLIYYALKSVDLENRPWVALPIKPQHSPTLYPVKTDKLYFNIGCYCQIKQSPQHEEFYYTKLLDEKCFSLGGIKMLYSSTFINKDKFDQIYNGLEYQNLKQKYDAEHVVPTLYEKVVLAK